MSNFDSRTLGKVFTPSTASHKGENGKLLIIAGSSLFHGAALWPAEVASRIVDLVFFSSTPLNNSIIERSKEKFHNGIVVPRTELDNYINEAECVLVGPGMMRTERPVESIQHQVSSFEDIIKIEDEGEQTYCLTRYLLENYPEKKFVIDGGALQMMDTVWLKHMNNSPILTPHRGEFGKLFGKKIDEEEVQEDSVSSFAKEYSCVVLVKGARDIVCDARQCVTISGGNPGMTKGGTGDVLAGLVASLYTKNDAFLSASAASYVNKRAGDTLFDMVGPYYNASDLVQEIPVVMQELMG